MCDDHDVTYTYDDFLWFVEAYPWVENALCVTYVSDASPDQVIDAMAPERLRTVTGLAAVNEQGWEHFGIVGAAQLSTWTVAIAPSSTVGVNSDVMVPLSQGRQVVSLFQNINAVSQFAVWRDGSTETSFDPLLRDSFTTDPLAGDWPSLMRQAGLDPDPEQDGRRPDGKFHILDGMFAMAANYTGLPMTADFFADGEFICGNTGTLRLHGH